MRLMLVNDDGEAILVADMDDWDLDKPLARQGIILEIIAAMSDMTEKK